MLTWIHANLATIVILFAFSLIIAFVLVGMIRARKQGKSSCGCSGCAGCAGCASCPSEAAH